MIKHSCKSCGQTFEAKACDGRVYCSKACYFQAKRDRVMVPCQQCGEIYQSRPYMGSKYCSQKCSGLGQRTRVTLACEHCGKIFETNKYQAPKARFCSKACRAMKCSVGIHIAIKSPNRVTRPKPYEKPGYIKLVSKVRKRDGHQCQQCGKIHPKGSRQLEVHHKIPIRLGGRDEMSNLVTLCVPCHRRTDNALRFAELAGKQLTATGLVQKELF